MATNINGREKIPAASPRSLVNADAWRRHRRGFGRAALTLAFSVYLAAGGVRHAPAQTYSVVHSFNGLDGSSPVAGLIMDASGNLYGTTDTGGDADGGTVFKMDPSGNETVLHNFSGEDGAFPMAGLVMDSSGNLYGTTVTVPMGGSWGTVFKLDLSGNETVLVSFDWSYGALPYAGLVMDASGNLYGTAYYGGSNGGFDRHSALGTVFKVDPSGNATLLHSFGGGDGACPDAGLIMDASGNLYGTTFGCDFGGPGTVFKLDTSGDETVLHRFSGGGDGEHSRGDLLMDASGNLYGTTSGGGSSGQGTVFKLDTSDNETLLHTFSGLDGSSPVAGLIMDAWGNLYGTTALGGSFGNGTVFKLDPSGSETVLHSFSGSDGANPSSKLLMDAWGNLYGTTASGGSFGNGTVFKLDMSVPFSAFSAKLDIGSWPKPRFQLKGEFTQGAGAEAIDPVTQPVRLIVGTYTVTIPAGSFRPLRHGAYAFEGAIDGAELRVHILQTETNNYRVHVDAACVDLTESSNPVPVSLYIGKNNGATEVTADFERRGMMLRFECPCEDHRGRDRGREERRP